MWVLLAMMIGCGSGGREERGHSDPNTPVDGDTLVWGVAFDPGNANPLVAPYSLSAMIIDLVEPGLARRTLGDDGLSFEPALASSWAWSDDGMTLSYSLRPGLVWEDGVALTSEDVAFTHSLNADPLVASNWFGDAKQITAVETPDAQTVVFRFTQPRNPILQQGTTFRGIVPKHVLQHADRATLRGHASARKPLASGPFRIRSWAADDRLVLEANPKAPADWRPHLDRILVRVLPEYSTRLLELERGDLDLLGSIEYADVARLSKDLDLRLIRLPANSMNYIGYRLADPRFSDLRVRTALAMGLDRDGLIDDLLTVGGERYGRPCIGTVGPTLGAWHNDDVAPLPYDPVRAAALLDAAGWVDSDGDGVRDKDGQPLAFKLLIQNGYALLKRIGVRTQAQWRPLGVELHLDIVEPTRFSLLAREKQFDAILWSFGSNPKVDPSIQWSSEGRYNWFGYSNPQVDALLAKGVAATDVKVSQAAFREVQARVHADQPATFLFWTDEVVAISARLRATELDTFSVLRHAERWYVPLQDQAH